MRLKHYIALFLCLTVLAGIPVLATEPENSDLPPLYVGVAELQQIPESWGALEEATRERQLMRSLTAEQLYRVSQTGEIQPAQAAALPEDVTAEFAGTYGIPTRATGGYAFAVSLRPEACWEDGSAVRISDWYETFENMLEADCFPLELANYRAFLQGQTKPSDQIISLKEAGFDSVGEAEADGHTDFYIDITHFWGLDAGWLRVTDRTRLEDTAIPSGCEEMYLTAEYLYRTYLSDSGSQTEFQCEFVGIPREAGARLTMEDVGLVTEEDRLVLILEEPATVCYVAAALTEPVAEKSGMSCGPYRVVSAGKDQITLEPNPQWTGTPVEYEILRIRKAG